MTLLHPIPPYLIMDSILFRITEEDIQGVARDELGRPLTPDEMESVRFLYEDDQRWYDTAATFVHLAAEKST